MGRLRGIKWTLQLILILATALACQATNVHAGSIKSHAYVAACVLAKNEHLYIREFIEYHKWIGIGKFYVWDHQSQPTLATVLEDFVLRNVVEVFYFSSSWKLDEHLYPDLYNSSTRAFLSPQGWAYDNCFRMFGHRHTFMALLDPDEYIVLKEPPPAGRSAPHLPTFLTPFEPYGGLMAHWQILGPSGHVRRPNASTLASYTQCMPRHTLQRWPQFHTIPLGFLKSFTATRCYHRGCNPHLCQLKAGCRYVNEKFQELAASVVRAVHWDRIAIYHFVTRSVIDYKAKMSRGSGHSQFHHMNKKMGVTNRGWRYFLFVNATSTDTCWDGKHAWEQCAAQGVCKPVSNPPL